MFMGMTWFAFEQELYVSKCEMAANLLEEDLISIGMEVQGCHV
jgi:hypothetical protein